ncbi:hypothetical protein [Flavobacterium sp. 5]|uniref:hypothetical protein n=1 Tax=Flavobacterium sp. 5 TaxID=2035199 RepID=UPI000C2C4615|nr:hypothetical protein [Flavobacterium sp. 5]PKB15775.1 hypothetical protein CLU82_0868 [Flavobacterium sp. 5]
MLILVSVLILFIPLVFQIISGNKSLNNLLYKDYLGVCIASLFMQVIITFFSFFLAMKGMTMNGNKCVTGAVAIFGLSFLVALLMVFIMVVQFVKTKLKERKTKDQESEVILFDTIKSNSNSDEEENL